MSLLTDIVFVKALRSNEELMAQLPAGDVYNTAIALPEEDADNAPLPYIIVSFDGMQNVDETKDDRYEGTEDKVQIGITVAADTRPQLGAIMTAIRSTIKEYFSENYGSDEDEDFALIPIDVSLSASPVQFDSLKPCYWQSFNYNCDTEIDE